MGDCSKLLYVIVQGEDGGGLAASPAGSELHVPQHQYNRSILQGTLQLLGCKPRHAHKISKRAFDLLNADLVSNCLHTCSKGCDVTAFHATSTLTETANSAEQKAECFDASPLHIARSEPVGEEDQDASKRSERLRKGKWVAEPPPLDPEQGMKFTSNMVEQKRAGNQSWRIARGSTNDGCRANASQLHKSADGSGLQVGACVEQAAGMEEKKGRPKFWQCKGAKSNRVAAEVGRAHFTDVVCQALSEYSYRSLTQREDFELACRVREHKTSVTVLLCGTSGCGKSTLASLLASRLGITTVVSTDSIRHMMRSFVSEAENPLLWASTYHAGEFLDEAALAKSRKKVEERLAQKGRAGQSLEGGNKEGSFGPDTAGSSGAVADKVRTVKGYKAQSEMVVENLDRLIGLCERRGESLVVEGVHLSLNFVMGLMKRHPTIIPFLIYIDDEQKHLERFAVRARYMALDSARNKYVKYIRNIRTIQDYLVKRADKHLVPKVNNTNVDKSVAAIHATVFSCLRRRERGEQLLDNATNTARLVYAEYQTLNSSIPKAKGVLQLIRRKGSHNSLLAVLNGDVALLPREAVSQGEPLKRAGGSGDHTTAASSVEGLSRGGSWSVGGLSRGSSWGVPADKEGVQEGQVDPNVASVSSSPVLPAAPLSCDPSKLYGLEVRGRVAESEDDEGDGAASEEGSDGEGGSPMGSGNESAEGSVMGDDEDMQSEEEGSHQWHSEDGPDDVAKWGNGNSAGAGSRDVGRLVVHWEDGGETGCSKDQDRAGGRLSLRHAAEGEGLAPLRMKGPLLLSHAEHNFSPRAHESSSTEDSVSGSARRPPGRRRSAPGSGSRHRRRSKSSSTEERAHACIETEVY